MARPAEVDILPVEVVVLTAARSKSANGIQESLQSNCSRKIIDKGLLTSLGEALCHCLEGRHVP